VEPPQVSKAERPSSTTETRRETAWSGLLGIHVKKTSIKVIDATAANTTSEQYLSQLEKWMVQLLSD